MKRLSNSVVLIIFFALKVQIQGFGQSVVTLKDAIDQYSIAYDNLSIYTDSTNTLGIGFVSKPEFQFRFRRNNRQLARNFDTQSTYWMKFKIHDLSVADRSWLFEFFDSSIEDISFYAPNGKGEFSEFKSGNKYPFSTKFYKHKNFEFQIPNIKRKDLEFYVRIRSSKQVFMYGMIRSYDKFIAYALNEYYFLGIFYGIILAMAIYNFLLFITINDKFHLYYVFYVLSSAFLCMVMDGTGFEYLWSDFPQFNGKALQFATFLMVIWAIMYTQGFIILKSKSKIHFNLLELLIVFRIIIFILSITVIPSLSDYVVFDIVSLFCCYISGIISYSSGNTSTKYFVWAFTFLFLGFTISNLTIHSIFGFSLPNNVFTVYSFNFGIVIEMILLSYALAHRFRLILNDRTVAQSEVILQLKANDDLKEKLNKELELKVSERTSEINMQRQELMNKNEELEFLYTELNQNIEVAKLIQLSILPPLDLVKRYLPNSYIVYVPKNVVSGDFYWFENRNDKIYIAAVDCTGHGVAGAFMSLIGYNILNQIVQNPENRELNAAQILDMLNLNVIESLRQNSKDGYSRDGMDLNLCILDLNARKLNYAGSVNYLYIIRGKELLKLVADPFSIGIPKSGDILNFTNHDFDLHSGDMLIQYTDGYPDQLGGEDGQKKFLYPKFRNMFLEISHLPLVQQEKIVLETFEKWKGNIEQTDDILVIGIKID